MLFLRGYFPLNYLSFHKMYNSILTSDHILKESSYDTCNYPLILSIINFLFSKVVFKSYRLGLCSLKKIVSYDLICFLTLYPIDITLFTDCVYVWLVFPTIYGLVLSVDTLTDPLPAWSGHHLHHHLHHGDPPHHHGRQLCQLSF